MIGGYVSSLAKHLTNSFTPSVLSYKLLLVILLLISSKLSGLSAGLMKNVQMLITCYYVFWFKYKIKKSITNLTIIQFYINFYSSRSCFWIKESINEFMKESKAG